MSLGLISGGYPLHIELMEDVGGPAIGEGKLRDLPLQDRLFETSTIKFMRCALHRDIEPRHILRRADGRFALIDFDSSRSVKDGLKGDRELASKGRPVAAMLGLKDRAARKAESLAGMGVLRIAHQPVRNSPAPLRLVLPVAKERGSVGHVGTLVVKEQKWRSSVWVNTHSDVDSTLISMEKTIPMEGKARARLRRHLPPLRYIHENAVLPPNVIHHVLSQRISRKEANASQPRRPSLSSTLISFDGSRQGFSDAIIAPIISAPGSILPCPLDTTPYDVAIQFNESNPFVGQFPYHYLVYTPIIQRQRGPGVPTNATTFVYRWHAESIVVQQHSHLVCSEEECPSSPIRVFACSTLAHQVPWFIVDREPESDDESQEELEFLSSSERSDDKFPVYESSSSPLRGESSSSAQRNSEIGFGSQEWKLWGEKRKSQSGSHATFAYTISQAQECYTLIIAAQNESILHPSMRIDSCQTTCFSADGMGGHQIRVHVACCTTSAPALALPVSAHRTWQISESSRHTHPPQAPRATRTSSIVPARLAQTTPAKKSMICKSLEKAVSEVGDGDGLE
ncbi:hypothetical protein L198_07410 [Cryptococcus wingfieldii CBS 7118]|uniref:Uncharacterized protein n=1 Tax=Cryptococcus wingfieldii CBS 7118 TaxID=1295528 RepID=A0A1E3IBK1_9TREE|nr:hypothetical protein L198_07410 [Cryptococcus wingfieldii CBS 7118]ODN85848.1 hypothetical protein L198_07410 [Cryptococcus wingfieldii CBS 7118]